IKQQTNGTESVPIQERIDRMQKIIRAIVRFAQKMKITQKQGLFSKEGQTMKRCNALLPLAALAALCLNAPIRADEQVPFKGTFNPIILSATQFDATHVLFDVDVIVRATHMGKARGPAYFILDLNTFTYVGKAAWAAANGDEIFITFAGQFVPTGTPGLFDNVETFEVVGGTGRFEAATGACTAGGQFDAIT